MGEVDWTPQLVAFAIGLYAFVGAMFIVGVITTMRWLDRIPHRVRLRREAKRRARMPRSYAVNPPGEAFFPLRNAAGPRDWKPRDPA